MSLLALLAAQGNTPVTPPAGTDPRPVVADATLNAIRPNGRRIGLLRVGPGKDYATISAAVSAANTIQVAKRDAEGLSSLTPNHRVDIIIDAGTYTETLGLPSPYLAFYAANGLKDGFTVQQAGPSATLTGTLITNDSMYWEGGRILRAVQDNTTSNWPKHPVHHAGHVRGSTAIFARCTLDNQDPASSGGASAYGSDGGTNGYVLLYDCTLTPGGTNAHGAASTTTGHQTFAVVACTVGSGANWAAMNNIAPDELWVKDSAIAGGVTVSGAASKLHLSGSTVGGAVTAPTQDTRSDWPVPVGGLSPHERAHFGM